MKLPSTNSHLKLVSLNVTVTCSFGIDFAKNQDNMTLNKIFIY